MHGIVLIVDQVMELRKTKVMAKTKLLICGASGFIGRNIAQYFAGKNEYEVIGTYLKTKPPSIRNVVMKKVDLTSKTEVDKLVKGVDILIQAAATTSGSKEILAKPYYHVTDNAVMNSLIYRAAFEHKVSRVIFFSCAIMYGSGKSAVKEEDFDANKEIYPSYFGAAWTKVYIEKICEFYSRIGRTKYTVIRHSNIYGPYDKYDLERSHVLGATITKVMRAAKNSEIVVWGNGKEARDILYVSDLVSFVDKVIKKQKTSFEIFNVGNGSVTTIKELVEKIIKGSGKSIRIVYDLTKPHINTSVCLNINKAKKEIGWKPEVSLEQGLKKTICWYKQNIRAQT